MSGQLTSIVDTHHHLWDLDRASYAWLRGGGDAGTTAWIGDYAGIRRSYLIDDYLLDVAGTGIARSVHIESQAVFGDTTEETRWLQMVAQEYGFPHAIVAGVDLAAIDAEAQLDSHLLSPNVRGVRTIQMGGFGGRAFRRGFAALAERGLSYDANLRLRDAQEALDLAEDFPGTTVLVGNFANPHSLDADELARWRVAMAPLASTPNVVMKVSGLGMADHHWTADLVRPWVHVALELFGPERCVFGSNWPVDRLYGHLVDLVAAIRSIVAEFDANAVDSVFCRTAERCYRL